MVAAAKIKPRHRKRHAGAYACLPQRLNSTYGWLSGLKLQADPVIEGVSLRFLHIDQDVLLPLVTFGILDGRVHLAEDAQIVKMLLRVQHIDLAQRVTRLHRHLTLDYIWSGVIQPRYKDLIHENLYAFMNPESHVHVIGVAGRLGAGLEGSVGETMIEVIIQNDFTIFGNSCLRESLSRSDVERRHRIFETGCVSQNV